MTEFLKRLRRSANPCKEISLPESGYYKGTPLGEDSSLFREHIEREREKALEHLITLKSGGYGIRLSDMVHRAESTAKPSSRYETSTAEAISKMKEVALRMKGAEKDHSAMYDMTAIRGWFVDEASELNTDFFEGTPLKKKKEESKSEKTDVPLTQTDMVW